MRILLTASSKVMTGFDRAVRIPNLGLCSISANLDRELCDVKVLDLVLIPKNHREKYFRNLLKNYQPDVVGFSCMTFQYCESLELAKITKEFNKNIKVVLGGYHPTVAFEEITKSDDMQFIDFVMRGEGEIAFNELIKALNNKIDIAKVPNLSYIDNGTVVHNPNAEIFNLDDIKPPDRDVRIIKKGFHFLGLPADAIETSRGCAFDCKFCCITRMYRKKFRKHKIDRIIDDIRDTQRRGAKALLVTDDNVTLDTKHYKEVCEAIIDSKLNNIKFFVQAGIKGLKDTPGLIEILAKSGVKWAFLGLESESDETLNFLNKSNQFKSSDTKEVIDELRGRGIIVIGGFILGNPNDTEESLWATYQYAKKLKVDFAIFGILTPYPGTPIRDELIGQGLVTNLSDYSKYNCYRANVKTNYVSSERLFELLNTFDARYPIDSGTIWGVIRQYPLYFITLTMKESIRKPKDVWEYIAKGIQSKL